MQPGPPRDLTKIEQQQHFYLTMEEQQGELITKKEGYEAMLYAIRAYWENSGSKDLTDILSGGEYWMGTDQPADSAFWEYWIEAIEKVRKDGPMFKEFR